MDLRTCDSRIISNLPEKGIYLSDIFYPSFGVGYEGLFSLLDCYNIQRRRLDEAKLARVRMSHELQQKQTEATELAARLKRPVDQLRSANAQEANKLRRGNPFSLTKGPPGT